MLAVGGGVSKETEEGGMKEFRENGRERKGGLGELKCGCCQDSQRNEMSV